MRVDSWSSAKPQYKAENRLSTLDLVPGGLVVGPPGTPALVPLVPLVLRVVKMRLLFACAAGAPTRRATSGAVVWDNAEGTRAAHENFFGRVAPRPLTKLCGRGVFALPTGRKARRQIPPVGI